MHFLCTIVLRPIALVCSKVLLVFLWHQWAFIHWDSPPRMRPVAGIEAELRATPTNANNRKKSHANICLDGLFLQGMLANANDNNFRRIYSVCITNKACWNKNSTYIYTISKIGGTYSLTSKRNAIHKTHLFSLHV